jgi:hypothetical protein
LRDNLDACWSLIFAERQWIDVFDCRVFRRSPGAVLFAFERDAATVAVDVYLEDRGVVNRAIDGGVAGNAA